MDFGNDDPDEKRKRGFNPEDDTGRWPWLLSRVILPLIVAIIGAFALIVASGNGEVVVNIVNTVLGKPSDETVRTQVAIELTQTKIADLQRTPNTSEPTFSPTPTFVAPPTSTPLTLTLTPTITSTVTHTATNSPTKQPSLTPTRTPSPSLTHTVTPSPRPTNTSTLTSTPTAVFRDQLTIPSTTNLGVQYIAPQSGIYIFTYNHGAFSVWQIPERAVECEPECFVNYVLAFLGQKALWVGEDINAPAAIFYLPPVEYRKYPSEQAAETVARGTEAMVRLKSGEVVTIVVGDFRSAYDDNKGNIVLDVYFIPA
jgi:hypothetical protein